MSVMFVSLRYSQTHNYSSRGLPLTLTVVLDMRYPPIYLGHGEFFKHGTAEWCLLAYYFSFKVVAYQHEFDVLNPLLMQILFQDG